MGIVRMSPPVRNTVKGLSFKSAGARLHKLYELVNRVLNGELAWMSDWAHGRSGRARLRKL